ncbi:MAG: bifunctional methylenetetrahydrofolate dehydrogenase/methenyltetrahydrofolate cyclohydrolase FolD [Bacteroidota bacterium]|jgi:methylenetetrahydrofolate dehydrogenase (NADP+)/methenyltetrahydrofolate cyclohydrolase
MLLLDGKLASAAIKTKIAEDVQILISKQQKVPHLAAILIGENPASQAYVANKVKTCAALGFESSMFTYNADVTEAEVIAKIITLNTNDAVDGILVQLPLPKHINESTIINAINPNKDVDGFHPINIGNMNIGEDCFLPATPYGIMLMLEYFGIETIGKHAVVVGRSNIVGTPMSVLLSRNNKYGNCTVTICHSKTKNIEEHLLRADIIVAAIGIPHFIKKEMVKDGAIIIDVGINRMEAPEKSSGYKLTGDVDFENVKDKASAITPVPGGVGLMTIAGLMQNTLKARMQFMNNAKFANA